MNAKDMEEALEWRGLAALVAVACVRAEVLDTSLDRVVDADLLFYSSRVKETRMEMRLEGPDWWVENATVRPTGWVRTGPAQLSLDTDLRQYSYSYAVQVEGTAVLDAVKLPGAAVRRAAPLTLRRVVFRFGPMTRKFLGKGQCNSSLVVDMVEAEGSLGGHDVSAFLTDLVAPSFNARSRAKCTVVNPHPCPLLLTPFSQGYF